MKKTKQKSTLIFITLLFLTMMGGVFLVPTKVNSHLSDINARLTSLLGSYTPPEASLHIISAYNVGDPLQNDSSPCIGASNLNLCDLVSQQISICAANFVPLYTTLHIPSLHLDCLVLDRTSTRYSDRVDLAFPSDQYQEALDFGLQEHEILYRLP